MNNSAKPDRGMKAWLCALARSLGLMAPEEISATHHPEGAPGRILLMRHAEKTGDPNDILLSPEGVIRAARLVTYIPQTFGRPDFIYAAARSKRSIRSIETVKPLAASLNIEVQHHIEDRDFKSLITEIFSKPEYRGKMIVICWHHKKLPEIASLLGAREGSYPAFWPQNVFNLILDFRYDSKPDSSPIVGQIVQPF